MKNMVNRIFPSPVSNIFPGYKLALYVFVLITIFTVVRSLIHILATDGGAQSIANIPLDTFGGAAKSVVIHIFSLWGLAQLLMGIVYVVVLFKYKSLIPLMYILIIIEYSMRIVLGIFEPIETLSTPPGAIVNLILIPLSVLMLLLSLKSPKKG
jgi:hypothetical protein